MRLELAAETPTLSVGGTARVRVTAFDRMGTPVTSPPAPSFTSSDPGRATVDANGVVTGRAAGPVTITATVTTDGGSVSGTSALTVRAPDASGPPPAPVAGATVETTDLDTFSPPTVRVPVGAQVTWKFTAGTHNVRFLGSVVPAGGHIPDLRGGATAARTFDTKGTFDYVCTRHQGMTGQVVVSDSVPPPVFTSLRLTPAFATLAVGGAEQLEAVALDQNGNPLAGAPAPRFSTSAAAVATVSDAGRVTALAGGSATITATLTSGGATHQATSSVTVTAPVDSGPVAPPAPDRASIAAHAKSFSPREVTIARGGTVTWTMVKGDHDVVFTGTSPPGGNIPETDEDGSASRTFPEAGTYAFACSKHADDGMTGTVTVVDGAGAPPPTDPGPAPATATVDATDADTFAPPTVTIPVGGTVTWRITGGTHNVTFRGTVPEGGNIPDMGRGGSASRTFTAAGTHSYECTRHGGMTGTVVVR